MSHIMRSKISPISIQAGNAGDILVSDGSGAIWVNASNHGTHACSKCGELKEIAITYNWCDNEELRRRICKECNTTMLDKLYGLDRAIKTEKVLYETE